MSQEPTEIRVDVLRIEQERNRFRAKGCLFILCLCVLLALCITLVVM